MSKGKKIQKKCEVCNKEYFVFPYRKDITKTCSIPCSYKLKDKNKKRKAECKVCLTRFASYLKGAKYCSIKCRDIDKVGEKHHLWTGGTWLYLRKVVLVRDNFTCQMCNFRDVEIMEVNHILHKAKYPELARNLDNLETLCPNCHRRKTVLQARKNWL